MEVQMKDNGKPSLEIFTQPASESLDMVTIGPLSLAKDGDAEVELEAG